MKTIELYDAAYIARLKKTNKTARIALYALIVLTVGLCLFFIFSVSTATQTRNLIAAMIVNGVGGSAALWTWLNVVRKNKRLIGHAEGMLAGERIARPFDAPPQVALQYFAVPHSIDILHVKIASAGQSAQLFLERGREKPLGELPARGTFYTVNNYIVALEEGGGGDRV